MDQALNIKGLLLYVVHVPMQEAHGSYRSPEKKFQAINTFAQSNDYAIILREKKHYFLCEN